ncbi:unnamed protein product [Pieris brassicae]|uniref:Methyltransferase domain-containing protein n=1 Tax=Pieris brassicae TaxID=7116 RepID=A0A9P0TF52_PIEBR|nr:unnamed protein product [Pieris brassicae]
MNNADLYNKSNIQQKTGALQYLREYYDVIQWKKNSLVLDIGCGDGSVTSNVIKKSIPYCKTVIGCDVNEDMIRFANEHYSSESVQFTVFDIAGDLPDALQERFHHAFSFFVIHWVQQQENAFRNIYNLLQKDGDCLATFVGQAVFYDALRELAKRKKWKIWLKDTEKFISPYHDSSNPEKQLREMLDKIGFSFIEIHYKRLSFEYESAELFQEAIKALTPFKIPEDIFDEYLDELFEEMQRIDFEVYKFKKSTSEWVHNFHMFVLYIKK